MISLEDEAGLRRFGKQFNRNMRIRKALFERNTQPLYPHGSCGSMINIEFFVNQRKIKAQQESMKKNIERLRKVMKPRDENGQTSKE